MNKDILATVGQLMLEPFTCGLNIGMINNELRNKFYDELLKKCKGKRCIEIGGGSGILTFLALKHGAKHVTCFEMDKKVYEVLSDVVSHCGMSDKVTLINEKFVSSRSIEKYNLQGDDLIFHELFGSNMWNDPGWPIRSTFDQKLSIPILPNKCMSDFYIIPLPEVKKVKITQKIPEFSPKVKLDPLFIDYYNFAIDFHNNNDLKEYECFVNEVILNNLKISKLQKSIKKYHNFCFDLNDSDYMQTTMKFNLPNLNTPYILLISHKVESNNNILKLTEASSFGARTAYYISSKKKNIIFELDMLNGATKIDDVVIFSGAPLWSY